jgi:arabinose-5-phosphate isomerase
MQTQKHGEVFLEYKNNVCNFVFSVLNKEAEAILKQKEAVDDNFIKTVDFISKIEGKIAFSRVGKSKGCAIRLAATFSSVGIPSFFIDPVDAIHGDMGVLSHKDAAFLISYSGETKEIKNLVLALKKIGIKIIGMCSNKNSFLALNSDFCIYLSGVEEACPNGLAPSSSVAAINAVGDSIAFSCATINSFTKDDFHRLHPGGSLGKITGLKVKDVMRKLDRTPYVFVGSSIALAIEKMTSYKIGAVCVTDSNMILKGYFSDGDLRRLFSQNKIELFDKIDVVMNCYPVSVSPDRTLEDAVLKMKEMGFDNIPVVDENNILKGIIDERDALIL